MLYQAGLRSWNKNKLSMHKYKKDIFVVIVRQFTHTIYVRLICCKAVDKESQIDAILIQIPGCKGNVGVKEKALLTRVRTNFCTDEFCSWTACLPGSLQILLQIAVVFTWFGVNFKTSHFCFVVSLYLSYQAKKKKN